MMVASYLTVVLALIPIVDSSKGTSSNLKFLGPAAKISRHIPNVTQAHVAGVKKPHVDSPEKVEFFRQAALKARKGQWKGCSFEIVTLDSRPLYDNSDPMNYWGLNAAINEVYAQRYGYNHHYITPDLKGIKVDYDAVWLRAMYFNDRLQNLPPKGSCKWMLYLDSDAFVRENHMPLDEFLGELAWRYDIPEDAGVVAAEDYPIPAVFPHMPHFIDPGVLFVRANEHSQSFFNAWLQLGRSNRNFTGFPGGMHSLMSLYQSKKVLPPKLNTVDMLEISSPFGRFIDHAWKEPFMHDQPADQLARLGSQPGTRLWQNSIDDLRRNLRHWRPETFILPEKNATNPVGKKK